MSFVRTQIAGESPISNESVKCGGGFDCSGISQEMSHGTKVMTVRIEAMTPNLFQKVRRWYLWYNVIFTP